MIPSKVVILIARTRLHNQEENNKRLAEDLDVVDELIDLAKITIVAYQQRIPKFYNKNIRIRIFKGGYIVHKGLKGGILCIYLRWSSVT